MLEVTAKSVCCWAAQLKKGTRACRRQVIYVYACRVFLKWKISLPNSNQPAVVSAQGYDGSCASLGNKNAREHKISQVLIKWPASAWMLQRNSLWLLWCYLVSVRSENWAHVRSLVVSQCYNFFFLLPLPPALPLKKGMFHKVSISVIYLPKENPSV